MSEESAAKRLKTNKTIGTHNGTFHCDEALAVFMLRLTDTYKNADVTRTRDPALLDTCDIVVDVGAVYEPEKLRYDHHQRGFTEIFGYGFGTKLSSAGLIYKHYGKEIIASQLGLTLDDPKVEILWLKMYREFIEALDGIDNGVLQYPQELAPAYRNKTDLSSRVGWLNPAWNEPMDSNTVNALFQKASDLAGSEFLNRLHYYGKSWLPARDIVAAGLESRFNAHPSGQIILFDTFAPWKEHIYELEKQQGIAEEQKAIYVIYPDETGGNWRVQAVSISPDSFVSRKPLPEPWRGMRDDELSKISGIPECIFVHSSGFIGGNKTKEGALEMARKGLTF
ncbi:hypothetical protein FRC02_001546 [Tulasnella sp. 418]|nr:hypothetical protein FRC02_001546 [Tulasnella sp. 418]